ncbi:glycosyltransferase family 2 protein [Pseudomonas marginalis]|uniref:Glycosyltransferase 2-like domain-containing protein n=1 Tax=Pseudomonas marginalis pv. marginalis TaxID=97473 RepID=A0A3M4AT99_PSEMA|nr:glycosyltransferase family 2 protein [Pseudomonas marginalis]RMP09446.1 hypothetical protein ALQ29_03419 [Pseudomonas marginalis pv. marginalis]
MNVDGVSDGIKFADVSVVIPCYKCKDTIIRALDSVFNQTTRPVEVILVEDASGDETLKTLLDLRDSYPNGWIKVITLTRNSGPATARNEGWNSSTQRYIAFLDSDDSWHPQKIEIQYGWMEENLEASITGQSGTFSSNISEIESKKIYVEGAEFHCIKKRTLLMSNKFATSSVMLRKDIDLRFPENKRFCEDYELWCTLMAEGHKCYYMNCALTFFYKPLYGFSGLSSNLWSMEKGELDVYSGLYRNGYIGFIYCVSLQLWSMTRYMRRAFKTMLIASPL